MKKPKNPEKYRKLFYETARQKILEHLFKYPDVEFSLSDLARDAGVSKANIGDLLKEFEQDGLIKITPLTKIWRIRANQQNLIFIRSKIVFNLNYIYQSGLVELLNELYNNPRAIILFGSFRTATDISTSDIDIAIETDEEIPEGHTSSSLKEAVVNKKSDLAVVINLEKEINRQIQVHLISKKSRDKVDVNVFNNIANGIILSGFLEVRP